MSRIGIYGAGTDGKIFLEVATNSGVEVDFFIDQYVDKKQIRGKPVYRLDEVIDKDAIIYISVSTYQNREGQNIGSSIILQLKQYGFKHIYDFAQTLHVFPDIIQAYAKQNYAWLREDRTLMLNDKKLETVKHLLSDQKSIDLLEKIKLFRKNLTPQFYIDPDHEKQYFPRDIDLFLNIDKVRFIDGGAYTGDTLATAISEFKKINKDVEYIASFEPDVGNIDNLIQEIKKQQKNNSKTNFIVYPCALWSSNEILQFSCDNNASSSVVNESGNEQNIISIMGVSIDKTLIASAPNFIKMDIEGAEKEAILGAKETIDRYKPVLAICLYHKPQDLWELPLLIQEIYPNYKMYLRVYAHMGIETVLYCVP